ncbi:hypothetical protein [Paraburkholderia sp.]|uniref:hypothetical protein n=1 Tax=Paraburkholderia sp. TaxID=1926495 RepID=UPI00238559AF|nr:hypothetical protein [Paraburkholderia sp.]MDE1182793.1 hypothetical protein [Paraburkholderia sp.]
MAESMVGIVVVLMLIAIAAVLLGSKTRRDLWKERLTGHDPGHRSWRRMRHRH